MNVLVVVCHPLPTSFTAAIGQRAVDALLAGGHDVRVHDLYADGFDPHVTAAEIRGVPSGDPTVRRYGDDLRWARTVVMVHPTWWSSQPAMLTGWLDRLLAGGATYRNVRRIVVATTHGSSKLVNMVQGEGGKRIARRTLRRRCSRRCRTTWIALYGVDRATAVQRAAHLARVQRTLAAL